MTSNPLSIRNVSVSYGSGDPVVNNISLDVAHGETFGLMGANGAGKTTLIKALLGLRSHQAGEIDVFDQKAGDREAKKRLAYLPERFEPPWFLSGAEFLKFSLGLYGHSVDRETMRKGAEMLALDPEALFRRVQTYSKGMRQKLGLLSVFLAPCDLLVLDEPMSGLDPLARARVKSMLVKAGKDGKSLFISSHILADMEEICDRVTVLHKGVLQVTAPPAEILKNTGAKTLEHAYLSILDEELAA